MKYIEISIFSIENLSFFIIISLTRLFTSQFRIVGAIMAGWWKWSPLRAFKVSVNPGQLYNVVYFESLNQTVRQRNEAVKGGGWVSVVARGSAGSP